jgi:sugar/nucleoside kinase (ribokinase family)
VKQPAVAPGIDYLVIGHAARDLTPSGPRLGGTVAFAGLTARALGYRPAIVTSTGPDLDLSPLDGLPRVSSTAVASTTFENQYSGERRSQRLLARANRLNEDMIPNDWRSASVVHVAPIADEIHPALASRLDGGLLGITAQGWLRHWDDSGEVQPRPWGWASQGLSAAEAVIVSLDDLGGDEVAIEEMAGVCRLLVVTDGPRGCRVYWNGDVRRVPVSPRTEVDPTGAGDIFAAAFFCRLHSTRDPWEAARFANLLAAASVGRSGLDGIPTAEEIRRADLQVVR